MTKPEREPPDPGHRRPTRPGRPPLRILFEDEDLLILDKPHGLPTAIPPGVGPPRRTLFDMAKQHARAHSPRTRVWVVHRLDAEVSGVVVFAKSERAFEWLKEDLRARRIQREYLALVEGTFPAPTPGAPPGGTIHAHIVDAGRGAVTVLNPKPGARPRLDPDAPLAPDDPRPAITHYRIEAEGARHTLLRVRLETGRRHQIRAHLAWIGHPVAGDSRYGARTDPVGRVALHAAEISFSHPATGRAIHIQSPAPPRMWKLVGRDPPALAPPPPSAPAKPRPPAAPAARSSWDEVANWYDELVEGRRNDLLHEVVIPGALHLLGIKPGERVLDLGCGQGYLAREIAALGALVTGVDASPRLIEVARDRSPRDIRFLVGDATRLAELPPDACPPGSLDAVACVMALMNMEPLSAVAEGVARLLAPGGRFVAVILHPAFRSPGRSAWGWEDSPAGPHQYRRIDSYLSPGQREIVMNPGKAARGARPIITWTYHRPLQTYIRQLAAHGLLLDALEEWPSPRRSEPGPRAAEENRARREIPMFLAFRGVRVYTPPGAPGP